MRFKAVIARSDKLRDICSALANLRPTCCLKIGPDGIKFISAAESGTKMWSTLIHKDSIFEFDSYHFQSRVEPEICMEFNVEHMTRALQKSSVMDAITIKLSKQHRLAVLTLKFDAASAKSSNSSEASAKVQHILPVKMIRHSSIAFDSPPSMAADIYIQLPQKLARISERYRRMASRITLKASNEGSLTLQIQGDSVNVKSIWRPVEVLHNESQQSQDDSSAEYQVTLDAKEWVEVLHCPPQQQIIIGISHEERLLVQYQVLDSEVPERNAHLIYYLSHHES